MINNTAKYYDKRYKAIQKLKFNLIFKKIKKFNADMILDLGCGTGLLFDIIKDYLNIHQENGKNANLDDALKEHQALLKELKFSCSIP